MNTVARAAMLGVAGLLLVLIGGFGAFRMFGADSVLGDVSVLDVELSGLERGQAETAVTALEDRLTREPRLIDVDGRSAEITGDQFGVTMAADLVDQAMTVGREGGIFSQLGWWISSFGNSSTALDPEVDLDPDMVDRLADTWDDDLIDLSPFPGAVTISGGTAVAEYPVTGIAVDRTDLVPLLAMAITEPGSDPIVIPTISTRPGATETDIDRAVAQADRWIGNPIVLTAPGNGFEVRFEAADLAQAFRSTVDVDGTIEFSFAEDVVDEVLSESRAEIEEPPVDAELEIEGYVVTVIPGRNGTLIDPTETKAVLESLAPGSLRRGVLPFDEGAEPEVTTESLEDLGLEHMVVQFTTYHDCCAARVTNIHLLADEIDGVILEPGETFGINDFVGERTEENGYREAGTIVRGEIVETVGGGISQFATTLYNAVFWGGYEDIQHRPHSFYFSRYPEGIESTVSFPAPEMSFRNDTETALMIKTSYTGTSITVRIFGQNDGRILAGSHRNGHTDFEVIEEGGPDARIISARVSDRTHFTEPSTEFRPNPDVVPGEQIEVQSPREGWTVFVTRTISQNGQESRQDWTVRYLAQRQIIEVNPCEVPESEITCETTTTTTIPDDSTTTTTEP